MTLYPDIPILITPSLTETLKINNLSEQQYRPAYFGEAAGLDLYNTGPDITILPTTTPYYLSEKHPQRPLDPNGEETKTLYKKIFKKLIPTGLHIAVPFGWVALIQERGSITNTSLKVRAGVIDPGYTGEVFVNCVNLSPYQVEIPANSKLPFQLVVVACNAHFASVTQEEYQYLTQTSSRKDGKIGSSN